MKSLEKRNMSNRAGLIDSYRQLLSDFGMTTGNLSYLDKKTKDDWLSSLEEERAELQGLQRSLDAIPTDQNEADMDGYAERAFFTQKSINKSEKLISAIESIIQTY